MHSDQRLKHIVDLGLPPYHLAVMVALNRHANWRTHQCHPSLDTIARESQVSRRWTVEVLQDLAKAGHINLKSGKAHRLPTVYTLLPRHLASAQSARVTSAPSAHEPTTTTATAQTQPFKLNARGIPKGAYDRKRQYETYIQPCGNRHRPSTGCEACYDARNKVVPFPNPAKAEGER